MKYIIGFVMLLHFSASFTFAESDNDKVILDKIYNDVIKSLPQSQRSIIDSAYSNTHKQKKQVELYARQKSADTANVKTDVKLPYDLNENLIKMMQQIDTMHQKRIIHFMTHDPSSK
jgi:hypothetical protein